MLSKSLRLTRSSSNLLSGLLGMRPPVINRWDSTIESWVKFIKPEDFKFVLDVIVVKASTKNPKV